MSEVLIGTILPKSVKVRKGKTTFYFLDSKNKVFVTLDEGVTLPEVLDGKFEISGRMTFHAKKQTLKLYASKITTYNQEIDYQAQIRAMIAGFKKNAS